MRPLSGRTALITGASGGLGQAIAHRLAAEGVRLTLTGRRADVLAEVARETRAQVLVCDLADRGGLHDLLEAAAGVDVVVANAALPATGPLDDFTTEQIDRALDVNLRAPILLARAAAPAMTARGEGHIVLVSSMAARMASRTLSLYAATKVGLRGFGLALRDELRATGVGVSIVYPGPISDAGMWAEADVPTPRGIRTRPPQAVAAAVVEAIEHNRAEMDVASLAVRLGATLASLRPEWFAALARRTGDTDELLDRMTTVARHKR